MKRLGFITILAIAQALTACGKYEVSKTKLNQPSVTADPYLAELQNDQNAAMGGRPKEQALGPKARTSFMEEMFGEKRTYTDDEVLGEVETGVQGDEEEDIKSGVTSSIYDKDKPQKQKPQESDEGRTTSIYDDEDEPLDQDSESSIDFAPNPGMDVPSDDEETEPAPQPEEPKCSCPNTAPKEEGAASTTEPPPAEVAPAQPEPPVEAPVEPAQPEEEEPAATTPPAPPPVNTAPPANTRPAQPPTTPPAPPANVRPPAPANPAPPANTRPAAPPANTRPAAPPANTRPAQPPVTRPAAPAAPAEPAAPAKPPTIEPNVSGSATADPLKMDICNEIDVAAKGLEVDLGPLANEKGEIPLFIPVKYLQNIKQIVREKGLDISSSKLKKNHFVCSVLPMAIRMNAQVYRQRLEVMRLAAKEKRGSQLNSQESSWLSSLRQHYNVKESSYSATLKKVDIVPLGLLLAQAAAESGWGTSRVALEANNLFGIHAVRGQDCIKADSSCVRRYKSHLESVAAYIRLMNTGGTKYHLAFQNLRAQMRANRQKLDSAQLAMTLSGYSERGMVYCQEIRDIMTKYNNLAKYEIKEETVKPVSSTVSAR